MRGSVTVSTEFTTSTSPGKMLRMHAAKQVIKFTIAILAFFAIITLALRFALHRDWRSASVIAILILMMLAVIIACLTLFPSLLVRDTAIQGVDRAKAENDVRGTLIQALAGIALLIGAYVTWSQLTATQRQLSIAEQQQRSAAQQQVNDQFSRGVEQLASASRDVRIGGIYALTSLANNTPDEKYPVIDILASYIREHAPLNVTKSRGAPESRLLRLRSPDVSVALIQLSTITREGRATVLLDHTDLEVAELGGVHLPWAAFSGADLRRAQFFDTDLHHAILDGSDLRGAELTNTDLSGADLEHADLRSDSLSGVNFNGADLSQANLTDTTLDNIDLSKAFLDRVVVCGANLTDTHFGRPAGRLIVFYADHRTQWPPNFNPSSVTTAVEITYVTSANRADITSQDPKLDLSGCR